MDFIEKTFGDISVQKIKEFQHVIIYLEIYDDSNFKKLDKTLVKLNTE